MKKTVLRIPKILAALFIFSIAYFYTDAVLAGNHFVLKDTLQVIVQKNYWHLWYLYAYISFIIALPFFRKLVISLDRKSSLYMFAVAAISMGVVPIIEYFVTSGINSNLKQRWLTVNIFIYPVIGYVIDNKVNVYKIKKSSFLLLWMVNLISFFISAVCEYHFLLREPGNKKELFLTNFCLVNAVSIYSTIKYIFNSRKINARIYHLLVEIGKCTFGIYLLHIWFLWKIPFLYDLWIKIEHSGVFGSYAGVFVSCILTFMITGVITYILRRMPVIKKLF